MNSKIQHYNQVLRIQILPLKKHNQTGVGHICVGQKDGVCILSRNGEGGRELEEVMIESECEVSALERDIVGVKRN